MEKRYTKAVGKTKRGANEIPFSFSPTLNNRSAHQRTHPHTQRHKIFKLRITFILILFGKSENENNQI